ncbi:DUF92 domain-containing protein [Acidobacteria bacterium AB60]|nr:DUF92 domain-containing protein [Acidobacteria bacterium AB60]
MIVLIVCPWVTIDLFLVTRDWLNGDSPNVAWWTMGLSALLGLLAWVVRSGTPGAAMMGALITATLMYATVPTPFDAAHTALLPVVMLMLLTSIATRFGRHRKESLGIAEERRGRVASQVCANLGVSALFAQTPIQILLIDQGFLSASSTEPLRIFVPALAALAEAAADTVSSEIGQVLGGTPRLVTTWQAVEAGEDGGVTITGSLAGIVAAGFVTVPGCWLLEASASVLAIAWAAAVFGLMFDSLLGATLERQGLLNNDAVNFLSTASAALSSLVLLAFIP